MLAQLGTHGRWILAYCLGCWPSPSLPLVSMPAVADRLGVSLNTVRSHIRAVYVKLQVTSKTEFINRVRQQP